MLERFKIPISWGDLFRRTFNEAWADDVLNLAAQQAYYFFFALFPALLALISIASFFPIENLMDEIVAMLSRVAPGEVTKIVTDQIAQIANTNAGGHPHVCLPLYALEQFECGALDDVDVECRVRHHRRVARGGECG